MSYDIFVSIIYEFLWEDEGVTALNVICVMIKFVIVSFCRYVHAECDLTIEVLNDQEILNYLCPICKNRDPNVSGLSIYQ